MSQSTVPQEQATQDAMDPETTPSPSESVRNNEFDYRPIPILAPVSMFFGVCSLTAFLGIYGIILGFFGIIFGTVSLMIIRRGNGELGGKWIAQIGFLLSASMFITGIALQSYHYSTELPPGFQRVHFNGDISKKGFQFDRGQRALHPDVAGLKDKKVFLKGFMWNTSKSTGLPAFLLLKDNGECCFGGDPKPTDMIWVEMQEGKKVDAMLDVLVSVAGVLRCDPNAPPGKPVYRLEATQVEYARTSF